MYERYSSISFRLIILTISLILYSSFSYKWSVISTQIFHNIEITIIFSFDLHLIFALVLETRRSLIKIVSRKTGEGDKRREHLNINDSGKVRKKTRIHETRINVQSSRRPCDKRNSQQVGNLKWNRDRDTMGVLPTTS